MTRKTRSLSVAAINPHILPPQVSAVALSLLLQIFFIFQLSPTITKSNVSYAEKLCLEHERTLLLELKNQWIFNFSYSRKLLQWNQRDDCCMWEGVECDNACHVISLQLDDEAISGGLSDSLSLFGLNYVEELSLAYNSFSGSLPNSITNLERLSYLDLSHCKFSGTIPFALTDMTELSVVDLSHNSLTGSIPITLSSLQLLDLRNNQFSGQVTEFPIVNSSNLDYIALNSNRLESPIPNSFFNLQSLTKQYLSDNLVNDTFQLQKILRPPNLTNLDLSSNNLSLESSSLVVFQTSLLIANYNIRSFLSFVFVS